MMKIGDNVLVEDDNGNIIHPAKVVDINDTMIKVTYTGGPLEGYTRWHEIVEISNR